MSKSRRSNEKLLDTPPTVPAAPLKLYTEAEVAEMFRVSKRTFVGFVGKHPFYRKLGKRKLFTEADIMQLYERLDDPPYGRAKEMPILAFRSPASTSAHLERLLRKTMGRRKPRT